MTFVYAIAAFLLILGAYGFGLHRGFARGYLTGLFDAALAEEVQDEDDETPVPSTEWQNAYLDIFGDRIDAGRRRRN